MTEPRGRDAVAGGGGVWWAGTKAGQYDQSTKKGKEMGWDEARGGQGPQWGLRDIDRFWKHLRGKNSRDSGMN